MANPMVLLASPLQEGVDRVHDVPPPDRTPEAKLLHESGVMQGSNVDSSDLHARLAARATAVLLVGAKAGQAIASCLPRPA